MPHQVTGEHVRNKVQVLDIHGEMGMGKSRIIKELIERWYWQDGATYLRTCSPTACPSYGRHTPYAMRTCSPAILRDLFGYAKMIR